jgi:hypothetical protein
MATCEGCCHLTGAILNLAAEAADRARLAAGKRLPGSTEFFSLNRSLSNLALTNSRNKQLSELS